METKSLVDGFQPNNTADERGQSFDSPKEESHSSELSRLGAWLWWFAKDQWFLIGLGIVIIIASQVQVPLEHQEQKQTVVSYLSVSIVFFVTGCTLPTKTLLENYTRFLVLCFTQAQCFLLTSALAFGVVSATASNHDFLDPWLLVGLIFNGALPTTISSNVVMTRQAHGNTALTVVQTTIGNFLGPFLTPLLIKLYLSSGAWYTHVLPSTEGDFGSLYRRVFMQLGLSIYLPMIVGQAVQNLFPKPTATIFTKWNFNKLGSLALLALLWQTFDHEFATGAFHSVPTNNLIFVAFISVTNWTVWLVVSLATSLPWLARPDVVSVAYCVPAKTLSLGVPISTLFFASIQSLDEAKLQIPMTIFQCVQVALGSIATIPLRKWVDKGSQQSS
ncbi:hypothetical protein FH972_023480 [Carpinus fangiana]|uniref:Sodium bile acid cotransporter n=1 Tax=Carpinus fangiana TaxID=176857 RepID=A0A5N6KVX2_9ROSI|nr:hypothetical protein FH972_023480 [Carpinus fangiana]